MPGDLLGHKRFAGVCDAGVMSEAVVALVLKLTLAPTLVAAATRVARRLGHRAGGLVGGLPVVAAPIVLIYAVEQGEAFAREAAAATVLGLVSLVLFCLAYAACARRAGYVAALAAGWLAFGVATALLSAVNPPLVASTAITLVAIGAGARLVSTPRRAPRENNDWRPAGVEGWVSRPCSSSCSPRQQASCQPTSPACSRSRPGLPFATLPAREALSLGAPPH